MTLFKPWYTLPAAFLALAATVAPAAAVTSGGEGTAPAPYVAAFTPAFGFSRVPYAGTMQLVVRDGTISGQYTGISVRPDRLNDHVSPVTGTLASDGHVQLYVGNALSVNGTMDADGTISGTAAYDGHLYDFVAEPGSPGQH
jgi:hypothetical protein